MPSKKKKKAAREAHVSSVTRSEIRSDRIGIGSDRAQARPGGCRGAYLEGLVHVLGPLLGPLGQLGALHRKEVVLLLFSREGDVDPRQLEPLHAQLLAGGGGTVAGQRRVVVVIVLGFHVQDGVHGGSLVPLVRRRPLLPRSLLDGPKKESRMNVNDDAIAGVVAVVGKLGKKSGSGGGSVVPPTRELRLQSYYYYPSRPQQRRMQYEQRAPAPAPAVSMCLHRKNG